MEKKKRIPFPWIKHSKGRICKALVAAIADKTKWRPVFKREMTRKAMFEKRFMPLILKLMPEMFDIVKKHYIKKSRVLTHDDFAQILYSRFNNMYAFDMAKGKILRSLEHPIESGDKKLRKAYKIAKKMYRRRNKS